MANQQERAVVDLIINGQQAKTTLKEVSLEVTRARSELNKMREADNPKLYAEKLAAMHKLVAAQKDMTARINDTSTAWGRFKKEMATVATGVVGGNVMTFLLQSLVQLIPSTIDRTMKLKDAFADLEKATGLSSDGVKNLNKELKQIDTRTTNQELRDIAVAGGQLGVANDQLVDFVQNVDKAVVALGDEFTGGVDQVAKEIGGIAKLFDETRAMEIGPAINNIGSALNELGAAGSATSPVVAEFTTRMGQLGNLAPKLAETLGLGAALQELGLTAEIAASGLSGLMLTAANKSDLFAQHLGMSKKAVEDLINTSPNQFLMQLAKSFEGMAPVQVAQRLKELKVESQESVKVMSLLANQTDFVAQKQALASKAMAEGTSLTTEFDKKNHQLARDLKELNEWFNSLLSSEGLQNFLVSAIRNTVEFTKALPQLFQWLSKNGEWLLIVGIPTLIAYNASLVTATLSAVANTAAEVYRRTVYELSHRWLLIQTAATQAYSVITSILTGQISLQAGVVAIARNAWAAFSAVLVLNPIGLIVTALTALVAGLKYFSEHSQRALDVERKLNTLRNQSKLAIELNQRAQQELNEKIAKYNDLSKTEQEELKKTIALKQIEAKSRLANVYARAREIAREKADLNPWEKAKVMVANTFSSTDELKRALAQERENNKAAAYDEAKQAGGADERKAEWDNYKKMMADIDKMEADTKKNKNGGSFGTTITDPDKKQKKTEAQKEADSLEKMLADSRERISQGERSDYDKDVTAFAEKYSRMYELAKDNEAKINEIRTLSLLEWAEIEKRHDEKQAEEDRKNKEKDNKTGFDAALNSADGTRDEAQTGIDLNLANHKIGENEARLLELAADQRYYEQKLLLEQTFAQDSADTQRQLNQNWNEQVKLRANTEYQAAEQMKQVEWALQDAKRNAYSQGIGLLKGFLKEGTIAYKAAIVAQKAFAIAQIIIDTQREIVGLAANPSVLLMPPIAREAYIAKSAVMSKIRAAVAIASIVGQGVQEMAAKADGGYTGLQELYPGSNGPSGFTSGPTLFNMGQRSYIAGEAGREFVVSNKALQNPVVADFTRMLDVAQKTGNYGLLMSGASGGSTSSAASSSATSQDFGAAILHELQQNRLELQQNRLMMEAYAQRPIVNNYRLLEQYSDQIQQIRQDNKL